MCIITANSPIPAPRGSAESSSRTRVQILVTLSTNRGVRTYLKALAKEFEVSPTAVRNEANHLHFPEFSSFVRKVRGKEVGLHNGVRP